MSSAHTAGHAEGIKAAVKAINCGFPRWIELAGVGVGEFIHESTGLPIATLSGPPSQQSWNESFAQGFNEEILAAVRSGAIEVDFRPLLMTVEEVGQSLDSNSLGTLCDNNTEIASPAGDFVISIRDSGKDVNRSSWINYRLADGREWPRFGVYECPVKFALGKNGQVLVMETQVLYLTCDVMTTQILNRYLRTCTP